MFLQVTDHLGTVLVILQISLLRPKLRQEVKLGLSILLTHLLKLLS